MVDYEAEQRARNKEVAELPETLIPRIEAAVKDLELPKFVKVAESALSAIPAARAGDLRAAWSHLQTATWLYVDIEGDHHPEISRLSSLLANKLRIIDDTAYVRGLETDRTERGDSDGS